MVRNRKKRDNKSKLEDKKCIGSRVTCHMSGVRFQVSGFFCHMSPLTYHLSLIPTATATDHPPAKTQTPRQKTQKTSGGMPILAIKSFTKRVQATWKRGFRMAQTHTHKT